MMEQKNQQAAPAPVDIPPLPAGGSWNWNGAAWEPKSEPAPDAPAATPTTTEE